MERVSAMAEDEDQISMALTAMNKLMSRCQVKRGEVGRLQVGSESLIDRRSGSHPHGRFATLSYLTGCYSASSVQRSHPLSTTGRLANIP